MLLTCTWGIYIAYYAILDIDSQSHVMLCTVLKEHYMRQCLNELRKEYCIKNLDGVGPVDNRPFTNKLHHFVKKFKRKENDILHVTCDT